MTTIFQLLNNKVEIFFPSLPLLPLHGAESRSQDTSLAYKNGGGGRGGHKGPVFSRGDHGA